MGYAESNISMDSRTGSVSSGLRSSAGTRGQTLKSSPFCPRASTKLSQSILKDHMLSHYKRLYSAKAAVDTSAPKSLTLHVKNSDRFQEERLKEGGRPQSAHCFSQRSSRASCSPAQSRLSVHYDERPYLCSRSSVVSSSRFGTSFHPKDMVYSSFKAGSQNSSHHGRPSSEIQYRRPEAISQRKQSASSRAASGLHDYKTFQDPAQKTYSGDLLEKHSHHFTQDKPFTPKTLKTNKSSYLSNYRYYRAPPRKLTQECTQLREREQETNHESTKSKKHSQETHRSSQGLNSEPECSEDEFSGKDSSASRQGSHTNKSRFVSSSRVSTEDGESAVMKDVSSKEEELKYLGFISAVTEDIISRRHISNRILDLVMQHHIDMNRHRLREGKMRHLLEGLRKDFEEPTNISTCSADHEKHEMLDAFGPHLESGKKQTKENDDLFPYTFQIKDYRSPDYTDPLFTSTPLRSPEWTLSPSKTNGKDSEDDNLEVISSPQISHRVSRNTGISEVDFEQYHIDKSATNEVSSENHKYDTTTSEEELHHDKTENGSDGWSKEMRDLESSLLESLHVSNNTHINNMAVTEQHAAASLSDDDF